MAETDPSRLNNVDRLIRINELRESARELGQPEAWLIEDDEEFADAMGFELEADEESLALEFDTQEAEEEDDLDDCQEIWLTGRDQLRQAGILLPPPENLDDKTLADQLAGLFEALARLRTYVYNTDHLSDRELYEQLYYDTLEESFPILLSAEAGQRVGFSFIDMVGSGSEEDAEIYLMYYADETERQQWAKEGMVDELPPRCQPPYDRDRHLPKPPEGF
jgi:hypothetical protein